MLLKNMKKAIVGLIFFVSCTVFQVATECQADKPNWPEQKTNKSLIINWLLGTINECKDSEVEYPSYDGWYHNLGKIDLGSIEQPLLRGWAVLRMDESRAQNWSKAWNQIISITPACEPSANALLLFFGKQVINEILDTETPSRITPEYDSNNLRNSEQFNYASPYIDGGIIYGRSRYLIEKQIVSEDGTIDINGLSELIMEKGNHNLSTTCVLRIIWLRWHNHVAQRISKICPKWTFKKVYNEARKWTIAIQQRIYAYEWLPLWTTKKLEKYSRYDPAVDPQVEKLFQAAMVIPHLIGDSITSTFFDHTTKDKSVWNGFWVDEVLKKLTLAPCKTCNISAVQQVEYVKQKYKLPDINHARKVFKLSPYSNWGDFLTKNNLSDSMLFSALAERKLQHLDAMMGGTLELRHGTGDVFSTVIYDQFRRIRDGDRFWFENIQNNLFSCEEVVKIGQISFADIILTVTNIDVKHPENTTVFAFSQSDNLHLIQFNNTQIKNTVKKFPVFFLGIYFYIAPFLLMAVFGIGTLAIAACFIVRKQIKLRNLAQKEYGVIKQAFQDNTQIRYPLFPVNEYVGVKDALRRVVVILKKDIQQITIRSFSGTVLRVIDLKPGSKTVLKIITLCDEPTVIIQLPHNYDLVLKFESNYLRTAFTTELNAFITSNAMLEKEQITNFNWKSIKSIIVTKEQRQIWLEMFFRVAFAQAFKIQHSRNEMLQVDAFVAKEVIYTELTIVEFADALGMHPENEFVKRMFNLVDKDKNGFISFREFVDLIIIFAEGSKEKKAQLLFDLYDINCTGVIPVKDFLSMIKSFLEIIGGTVDEGDIQKTITVMLRSAGVERKKDLDFNDFKKMIGDDINNLSYAKLGFKIHKQEDANSYLAFAKRTIESMYKKHGDFETRFQSFTRILDQKQAEIIRPPVQKSRLYGLLLFFELHSQKLFWVVFITLLIMFVFIERVYHSNVRNTLSGINWYIFGLTRGAKYAMVLTYAFLFITMCKNIWTKLGDLLANKYFPFDDLVEIHIYVSYLSAIFTAIHVVGEILIFYEIIYTSDDLAYRLHNHLMNEETFNIHMMFWQNYVIITGVTLTLLLSIFYVFTQSYIRQKLYSIFYFTHHNLYPLIIVIIIIHGSQSSLPLAYSLMSGPLILFLLDLFVSLRRKKIELPVLRAEFFPSNVICLVLRRPKNFQYKVGQWIRLAVPQISRQKFHSVSLSSAPHEPYLRIHVRPTTPWAWQVHALFEGPGSGYAAAPVRVLLDGPYGKGAQNWRLYDVVVLVGGGSGVASFAAMLKDVIHALQSRTYLHCQKILQKFIPLRLLLDVTIKVRMGMPYLLQPKYLSVTVYFIWVAKTQKHFEWMVDLIQETEDNDPKHFLSCHIFITEFYEKFDLRTIMLYICEKHYQRISGKSLFTNLKAVTHFGRPAFAEFFMTVQSLHPTTKHVGVFSSGPASLSRAVDAACGHLNSQGDQRFEHHSNNKF